MIMRSHLAVVLAVLIVGATASTAGAVPTPDTLPDENLTGGLSEVQDPPPPPAKWPGTGEPVPGYDQVSTFEVTGQEVDDNGNPVGTALSVSGTGGTSTSAGCKTVRVTNVGHTLLHLVAYKFWTQLHWCWNRDTKQISQVSRSWDTCCIRGSFRFDGIVAGSTHSGFYGWLGALYPKSGYYYDKTASFTNVCHLAICFKSTYPKNKIHAHSNGTWWFSKTGAG